MPLPGPRDPYIRYHPGSSRQQIEEEPDWGKGHNHRIGYRNRQERNAGFTHDGDHDSYENEDDRKYREEALRERRQLNQGSKAGGLVNFQDVAKDRWDFRDRHPDRYPPGWRTMIEAREDWIKKEQDWPANIKQREKKKEKEEEEAQKKKQKQGGDEEGDNDDEHDWRRQTSDGSKKHNDAYGKSEEESDGKDKEGENGQKSGEQPDQQNGTHKSEYEKLREIYSPEEITLLRHLQHEAQQTRNFHQNDGRKDSPVVDQCRHPSVEIDSIDAMTPDNWIPRSGNLIRNTGQHPLNAEPRIEVLFSAGLITPNNLHYVRNHAKVPRLYWDTHVLDVCNGKLKLSMDDLKHRFEASNIAVALACDGNRRGELNLLKKSKGFSWGPGAISCAYWKGAMLYDVLAAADVSRQKWNGKRKWVNFEGADDPSEGKYATSVPLDYALDPGNDVLLAYEMNNSLLPADHGYPVRLMIPGFVGGRSIKWLARIWISDYENDSYYHIWDNRVLPSFITEKDGIFARTMFNHPSTACMEQNLNSVIVRPGQGRTEDLVDLLKQNTYRIEGFAYDGGGHEVQRVEVSLDGGETWLYCIRRFPDRPLRNGNKFWTWIHWYIDVDSASLARAEILTVRCFNVFKNTQPQHGVWNLMGMMNNGWYVVKLSTDKDGKLLFKHPYDQEGNGEGWMTPSTENQLAAAKQNSGVPDKQFTRQEIEKHNSKDDSWLVINNNVYEVTSVLAWHPGGSATILANAGKLSLDVTSSFESIHDDYAHKKLQECVIGRITNKAANFMQEQAKEEAERTAKDGGKRKFFLQSKKWVPVQLTDRQQVSKDTFTYTFSYRSNSAYPDAGDQNGSSSSITLGLSTCQHIQFGIHMLDKLLIRSYTPTKPITANGDHGTFSLTVKTYYPDENQPGGAFSNFLLELPLGQTVEVCGPTGDIIYLGKGEFEIEGQKKSFNKINLILGGSGVTPGYALLQRICEEIADGGGDVQIRVLDANKSESDILLHEELDRIEKQTKGQIRINHILSHPSDQDKWKKNGGLIGHVNADMIRERLFPPGKQDAAETKVVTLLCGPPTMIQKAALPALKGMLSPIFQSRMLTHRAKPRLGI